MRRNKFDELGRGAFQPGGCFGWIPITRGDHIECFCDHGGMIGMLLGTHDLPPLASRSPEVGADVTCWDRDSDFNSELVSESFECNLAVGLRASAFPSLGADAGRIVRDGDVR